MSWKYFYLRNDTVLSSLRNVLFYTKQTKMDMITYLFTKLRFRKANSTTNSFKTKKDTVVKMSRHTEFLVNINEDTPFVGWI